MHRLEKFYTDPTIYKSTLQKALPTSYLFLDSLSPLVTCENNFDRMLIPADHPSSRQELIGGKRSDTFYVNSDMLLRTHTSAHQHPLLREGCHAFCVLGDVYRKDEIDATHYPVFHQMEAMRIYRIDDIRSIVKDMMIDHRFDDIKTDVSGDIDSKAAEYFDSVVDTNNLVMRLVIKDLKETHEELMKYLFTNLNLPQRWNPDYFPFTDPSFELEILLKEKWLEVLGSGIVHKKVLENAGINPKEYIGWASGVGLERLAMIMFDIPDIRLFWSQDERFLSQFEKDKVSKFKPFSKYPSCFKDISFYVR